MKLKQFLKTTLFICLLCTIIGVNVYASQTNKTKQPNIILILTDDQGYGDCGRHGHPLLKTPNMDRLQDESVRFDNFYVSPSCSPTRASLLTGMHEFKNGVKFTTGVFLPVSLDKVFDHSPSRIRGINGYISVIDRQKR